jgi:hypothetical protein
MLGRSRTKGAPRAAGRTRGRYADLTGGATPYAAPGFFRDHILPHLGPGNRAAEGACDARVVYTHTSGRVTVEYRIPDGTRIFAKFTPDDSAAATFGLLRALWDNGFGPGSRYRVPRPVVHLPQHHMVATWAAPGNCLWEHLPAGGAAWEEGLREAARWLDALHATPLRVGPVRAAPEPEAVAMRAAETFAGNRSARASLADAIAELGARARRVRQPRPVIQTHGTYNPWHVYLAEDVSTALDVDEASSADPCEDLGEFVFWLRFGVTLGGHGHDAAQRATEIFLAEYGRCRPIDAAALSYYWSIHALKAWAHLLGKPTPSPRAVARMRFLEAEFHAAPELAGDR